MLELLFFDLVNVKKLTVARSEMPEYANALALKI